MIYCVGETLLDVVQRSFDAEGKGTNAELRSNPGGAMLNAAVSLARAGLQVGLVTELGDDAAAEFIIDFLKKNNVETHWVQQYARLKTSVAYAVLDENKKAAYRFEKYYPDQRELIPVMQFNKRDVVLFGSLYSVEEGIRSELMKILYTARHAGSTLIYDPNIRQNSIEKEHSQWQKVLENIKIADVVKASDEDLRALFGKQSPEKLLQSVRDINPRALVIMTTGAKGLLCLWKDMVFKIPAQKVELVSTVGAGDGFNAGMIYGWINQKYSAVKLQTLGFESIKKFLQWGILFASEVCASDDNYIPLAWNPQ